MKLSRVWPQPRMQGNAKRVHRGGGRSTKLVVAFAHRICLLYNIRHVVALLRPATFVTPSLWDSEMEFYTSISFHKPFSVLLGCWGTANFFYETLWWVALRYEHDYCTAVLRQHSVSSLATTNIEIGGSRGNADIENCNKVAKLS